MRASPRTAIRLCAIVWLLSGLPPGNAGELPSVVSINLCTDQLVLSLADAGQILSLSWLAADPAESTMAESARRFPRNYGSAEELLRYRPDVVVGGVYTNDYARGLVSALGYEVVAVEPATSLPDIERNVRRVAAAVGQSARGERLIDAMRARGRRIEQARLPRPVDAVVLRPGGYTVGANSLADALMRLAGLRNLAAERGLDRWGSLSMESLLRSDPRMIIVTDYRSGQPSLANAVLAHPAVAAMAHRALAVQIPAAYWSCGLPESLKSAEIIQASLRRAARR